MGIRKIPKQNEKYCPQNTAQGTNDYATGISQNLG
jgi:hypothetical protein